MTDESLAQENERLKSQLEAYRERELAELHQRVADAEHAAEHYRSEAQRNADAARSIAASLESKMAELKAKLSVYEKPNERTRAIAARAN